MDSVVASFQEEIANNEELQRTINFDDRNVLINFGFPTKKEREQFDSLDIDAQTQTLRSIRATLPSRLHPSFSGGRVTLDEIVEEGLVSMNDPEETFESIREKMFDTLMRVAEARQGENKEEIKTHLMQTDPALYQFMLRSVNDRALSEKNMRLEEELEKLREELRSITNAKTQDGQSPSERIDR